MIPADKWPEWADRHCWDDGADGKFMGANLEESFYGEHWFLMSEASGIPLPPGHNWRVPVMRPTVKESLTVDLEHFRDLVHTSFTEGCIGIEYRDRLLSLIDGQKGVGNE